MQSGLHDKEMAKALSPADSVIWYEGQDVKRSISAELKKAKAEVYFAANISEIIQITRQIKTTKSNIVIMSNGDILQVRLRFSTYLIRCIYFYRVYLVTLCIFSIVSSVHQPMLFCHLFIILYCNFCLPIPNTLNAV